MCRGLPQSGENLRASQGSLMLAESRGRVLCDCPGSPCIIIVYLVPGTGFQGQRRHPVLAWLNRAALAFRWHCPPQPTPTSTPSLGLPIREGLKEHLAYLAPLPWSQFLSAIPFRGLPPSAYVTLK